MSRNQWILIGLGFIAGLLLLAQGTVVSMLTFQGMVGAGNPNDYALEVRALEDPRRFIMALGFDYVFIFAYVAFFAALFAIAATDKRLPMILRMVCWIGIPLAAYAGWLDFQENQALWLAVTTDKDVYYEQALALQGAKLLLLQIALIGGFASLFLAWILGTFKSKKALEPAVEPA